MLSPITSSTILALVALGTMAPIPASTRQTAWDAPQTLSMAPTTDLVPRVLVDMTENTASMRADDAMVVSSLKPLQLFGPPPGSVSVQDNATFPAMQQYEVCRLCREFKLQIHRFC